MRPEELTITNEANANKRAAFDEAVQVLFGELVAAAPDKPSRESLDHSKNFELDNEDCQAFENIVWRRRLLMLPVSLSISNLLLTC